MSLDLFIWANSTVLMMLWLVAWWKFWQEGHVSRPSGGRSWCGVFCSCGTLWNSVLSSSLELAGCCSFLLWKSRIWAGIHQLSKDALWKSSLSLPSPWKVLQHALVWGGPQEQDGPHHRFLLQAFPARALQAACASQHRELSGPVRIPHFCPVHWSAAAAAPCESLGGLGSVCFVFLTRGRNQEVARSTPSIQQVWKQPKMRCKAPKWGADPWKAAGKIAGL